METYVVVIITHNSKIYSFIQFRIDLVLNYVKGILGSLHEIPHQAVNAAQIL